MNGDQMEALVANPTPRKLQISNWTRFSHHPDKPFTGVYQEIAPPTLLVFEANGAAGKVLLAERAGGTRMTVEIVCRSPEHLAQFVAMGVAAGTSRTLDNLASHLRRA